MAHPGRGSKYNSIYLPIRSGTFGDLVSFSSIEQWQQEVAINHRIRLGRISAHLSIAAFPARSHKKLILPHYTKCVLVARVKNAQLCLYNSLCYLVALSSDPCGFRVGKNGAILR